MKTSARLQGAIEILQSILLDNIQPDKAFTSWGRAHKFAGSSDRRAIQDTVYDVLRHLGTLKYYCGGTNPRLLVAGWIVFVKKQPAAAMFDLFLGEKYGPKPFEKQERKIFTHPKDPPTKFEACYNISQSLESYFKKSFPDDLDSVAYAMGGRAPFDLRVNLTVTDRETVLAQLRDDFPKYDFKNTPFSSTGIRCYDHFSLKEYALFKQGHIDIQDESSQIACEIISKFAPNRLLDFCAGGGGKSLTTAIHRHNRTDFIASDISETRLKNIKDRAERSKLDIRRIAQHRLSPEHPFDMVWVDSPCSGTGTWRRNVFERMQTTSQNIDGFAKTQFSVLEQAKDFISKEGYLVYSTCSYLKQENDMVMSRFMAQNPDFSHIDITEKLHALGLTPEHYDKTEYGILLRTDKTKTDGFYLSVLHHK